MHCLSGISSRSVSGDRQITAVWKPTFGAAATRVLLLTARPGGQQRAAWGLELSSKCCCEEGDVLYCWFGGICCDLTLDRKPPVFLLIHGRLQVLYRAPRALRCCCPWLSFQGQNRGRSARHKCQASNHLKLAGKAGPVWFCRVAMGRVLH